MKKHFSVASFIFAAVALMPMAQAQDPGTLDLLVRKGVVTQTERDQILATKSDKPAEITGVADALKLTISGYVQVQYNYLHMEGSSVNPSPSDTNGFEIRRALVDFTAKMENGWGAYVTFISDATYRTRDYLERAAITYTDADYGCFTGGYRKVHFAVEEYSSGSDLPAIERSIVTNYFTTGTASGGPNITDRRTGFANRHVGLYWDGKFGSTEPFECGFAVTNAYTDSIQYASEFNDKVSLWAYGQQTFRPIEGAVLTAGLNFGWQPTDNTAVVPGEGADMLGWNPFISARIGSATFMAEYIGSWIHNG
ncbi:MAG: hypothetical protein LBV12_02365, partial [Puniceicoccales bacterium]|nr:hypothetical protein [Puniceicoccales bacterium]